MYCRNCGNAVDNNAAVCLRCGTDPRRGYRFCPNCGAELGPNQVVCLRCGINVGGSMGGQVPEDKKILAGLMGIFFGAFGVHNFVLGETTKGLIKLLISIIGGILTCGIATSAISIWGLVEGIMILSGSYRVKPNK